MSTEKVDYTSVPVSEKYEDPPEINSPNGFGYRHLQSLLLFASLSAGYAMRAHLSVTLVAMTGHSTQGHNITCINLGENMELLNFSTTVTNHTLNEVGNFDKISIEDCVEDNKESSIWNIYGTYTWSKSKQEMILFAFFVGYTTMMLPMGIIAQKFGGKLPICVALAVNGILSIMTPWMPLLGGWMTVCIGRLLQGMTQAAFYPSIHNLLGKWAPLSERGRLSTYVYTGSQFGTILAFQLAGFFAGSPIFGWPSTFWFYGIISLVCFCFLSYLGSASPSDHPRISFEELNYITKDGNSTIVHKTPWKKIMTSKPVWGLISAHAGSAAGYLLVLTQIPMYMNKVLGVDIKRNGVYSSLPYISMYFMTLLFGYLSDLVANKKIMSVANIRRISNTIGMVISGLFLIGFSYVQDTLTAVILMVLCMGLHSGVHVGFHINQIDLAPNFAGPMMAMGNMIANLGGLGVPVLVSNIVGDDVTNQSKWQILFIIFALVQFISNLFFVIFVKGTVQEWNFDDKKGKDILKTICKQRDKINKETEIEKMSQLSACLSRH